MYMNLKPGKKKLIKQLEKNLNEFKEDVVGEITNDTIKSIKESNIETINDAFATIEIEVKNEIYRLENDKENIHLNNIKNKVKEIEIIIKELSI